jgi:hypothetical protein
VTTTVLVTTKGYDVMTGRMKGSTPAQAEPLFVGWGTGGAASAYTAAVTDVAPFKEGSSSDYSTRVTGTSSQVTTTTANDTYQVTGTVTCGVGGGETIAEMFLADSSTRAPATTVAAGGSTVIGSATNTTMNVASASGFPGSGNYYVQVDTEVMEVTGGQGTTTWTVVRGVNGSTAISSIAAADEVTAGNIPGSTTITGGTVFTKASFTGLALNDGDSIAATFKVTVS